jgi:hypothetical protein
MHSQLVSGRERVYAAVPARVGFNNGPNVEVIPAGASPVRSVQHPGWCKSIGRYRSSGPASRSQLVPARRYADLRQHRHELNRLAVTSQMTSSTASQAFYPSDFLGLRASRVVDQVAAYAAHRLEQSAKQCSKQSKN